jgi:6-phosphogluconolactonase
MTRLTVLPDNEGSCARAAQEVASAIEAARAARGVAHVALAGGNTPHRGYQLLAPLLDDWSAVHLWYGDERCVDPDDPESNHRLVVESLLSAIVGPAPAEHRILGELGPERAASLYEQELLATVADSEQGLPVLDIALLGLGEDGHTASLFPGFPQVQETDAVCLPVFDAPKPPPNRVTLGLGVLRVARQTLLLVAGEGKAQALGWVLAGPDPKVPASLLNSERLHIIADVAAAPAA